MLEAAAKFSNNYKMYVSNGSEAVGLLSRIFGIPRCIFNTSGNQIYMYPDGSFFIKRTSYSNSTSIIFYTNFSSLKALQEKLSSCFNTTFIVDPIPYYITSDQMVDHIRSIVGIPSFLSNLEGKE